MESTTSIAVEAVVVGGDLVVELDGELDMASVREAQEALSPRVAEGPYERILVHARAVRFCDSSGLQFLLRLAPQLRARRGVEFLSVSPQLRRVLQVTGLETVLATAGD